MKRTNPQFVIVIQIVCLAWLQNALAVSPPPDGGYPGGNTAEGQNALFSRTTGAYNTAVGYLSLLSDISGTFNTAIGAGTLLANTGDNNTATGAGALLSNTSGHLNTAIGAFALFSSATTQRNTAVGFEALLSHTIGDYNNAVGAYALTSDTEGSSNNAFGDGALKGNTSGVDNTAIGDAALNANTTGENNTAVGYEALVNSATGSNNVALGAGAGSNVTTGDNNIYIGSQGLDGDTGTIRIGDSNQSAIYFAGIYGTTIAFGTPVYVDAFGQLGTVTSSVLFKRNIRSMGAESEVLLALHPVSFQYKKELDPAGTAQFGLLAEEAAKVDPDLVMRDKKGKPYSVRYNAINAMLLNEFLKEHSKVEKLEATVTKQEVAAANQEAKIACQQKQIDALTAGLQKVSAQFEVSKSAPQTVLNNQ